ncbi:uncharacterized protein LOC129756710 [Uranotaenia lowii]|uniref:uncharacterized protein LOC129756710 n=1 Tax=Uranotaenia lowii TaxID=190385 RepID=UPI00247952D0|nr:uncharacterized protein LOC129756710 [Uranotaenia lowii]
MLSFQFFCSLLAVFVMVFGSKGRASDADLALSAQLFQVIEFYKQADPVGLPLGSIPDPMSIARIQKTFGLDTIELEGVRAHGLSKLRIKLFKAELNSMTVRVEVQMGEMLIDGNYTLSAFVSGSSGPFKVILSDITSVGNVTLAIDREGALQTKDVDFDFKFSDMTVDFENLGFMGRLFQRVVNAASDIIIESIKPYMLREVHAKIQSEIDGRIALISETKGIVFPNSISPLDMFIGEARILLRKNRLDPFLVPDYNNSLSLVQVRLSNTWLRGLTSFYRVGDVSVAVSNHSATIGLEVSTGRLEGSAQWEISLMTGFLSRAGIFQFTIDYFRTAIEVQQPLDLRQTPVLNDLQLDMGNVQIYSHGAGSLDYLLEAAGNILPNLIRSQVMDAIEIPLRGRIREKLSCMNVEQFVKDHVARFERQGTAMAIDWRLCERKIPDVVL